jgi:hypothetical protein
VVTFNNCSRGIRTNIEGFFQKVDDGIDRPRLDAELVWSVGEVVIPVVDTFILKEV